MPERSSDPFAEEGHAHRGGAWKVAYADFVTALMALFIVLWLMSSGREVRDAVSSYFRDPRGRPGMAGSGQAGSGEGLVVNAANVRGLKERLEQAMARLPDSQKLQRYVHFTITGEGLRVELSESRSGMFFESGNARPSVRGVELLGMVAGELGRLPNEIVVEGHTDARAYRAEAYGNWELSVDRANMARRVLIAQGVRPDQVSEVCGYADRRALIPEDPNDTRNRRVSVILKFEVPVN